MDKEYKDKNGKTLWGLLKGKHYAPARWAVDNLDEKFLDTLSQEELEWFNEFMAGVYSNIFTKKKLKLDADGKPILRKDGKKTWDYSDTMFKNPTKMGIFDEHNARREDALSFKDLKGLVRYPDSDRRRSRKGYDSELRIERVGPEQIYAKAITDDDASEEDKVIAGLDTKPSEVALAGSKPRPVEAVFTTHDGKEVRTSAMSYADGSGYILKDFKVVDTKGAKYFLDSDDQVDALQALKKKRRSEDISSGARGRKPKAKDTEW